MNKPWDYFSSKNKQKGLAPILIVILIALVIGGYLIYQRQINNIQNQKKPYNGPPPEKIITLKAEDNCQHNQEFCSLLSQIINTIKNGNYSALLTLQEKVEKSCILGSLYAAICEGVKEGEKREGYAIGAQYSEYNILSGNRYIARLDEYFKSNAPLIYEETVVATNQSSIIYSNKTNKAFLIFFLSKNEDDWKIKNVILGVDYKAYLKTFYPTLE